MRHNSACNRLCFLIHNSGYGYQAVPILRVSTGI